MLSPRGVASIVACAVGIAMSSASCGGSTAGTAAAPPASDAGICEQDNECGAGEACIDHHCYAVNPATDAAYTGPTGSPPVPPQPPPPPPPPPTPPVDASVDAPMLPDGSVAFVSDAMAPLPPPVDGGGGYNAFWILDPSTNNPYNGPRGAIFLPLFSAPSCSVVPPYGEYYSIWFRVPSDPYAKPGPNGVFPACGGAGLPESEPCYHVDRSIPGSVGPFSEGWYQLSPFDANGIARGAVDTPQGLIELTVKNCM